MTFRCLAVFTVWILFFTKISASDISNGTEIICDSASTVIIQHLSNSFKGEVIDLEYGTCNINSAGVVVENKDNGFLARLNMFLCGNSTYEIGKGYKAEVSFFIGRNDNGVKIQLRRFNVASFCSFEGTYTAKYSYLSEAKNYKTSGFAGESSFDVRIQAYDATYTTPLNKPNTLAGSLTHMGLFVKSPMYDSRYLSMAPLSCRIVDDFNNSFTLFSFYNDKYHHASDFVLFSMDFEQGMWRLEHILFVFSANPSRANQMLTCKVQICMKSEFDSICNNVARKYLSEEKALQFITTIGAELQEATSPHLAANSTFVDELNTIIWSTVNETEFQGDENSVEIGNGTANTTEEILEFVPQWNGPESDTVHTLFGLQEFYSEEELVLLEMDSVVELESNDTITSRRRRSLDSTIPKNYDLRKNPNCGSLIGVVRNQANCGTCWAFSGIGVIQDITCLSSGGKFQDLLSPSELHQCSSLLNRPGNCIEGASPVDVFKWWRSNGLVTGSDNSGVNILDYGSGCYPYVYGKNAHLYEFPGYPLPKRDCVKEVCVTGYSNNQRQDRVGRHNDIKVGVVGGNFRFDRNTRKWNKGPMNELKVMRHIMQRGSVVMGFNVYRDFLYYKKGVYRPISNKDNIKLGSHAVKVIGWGVTAKGSKYWLCVNSWGKNWGKDGLFKMERGKNTANSEGFFFAMIYDCPTDQCANEKGVCAPGNCPALVGGQLGYDNGDKGSMEYAAPVDGSWSSWVDTTVCSESCGGGTLFQNRTCSDPVPRNGGLECPGSDSQSVSCNTFPCPDCNFPQTNSWYPYWERNGPFETCQKPVLNYCVPPSLSDQFGNGVFDLCYGTNNIKMMVCRGDICAYSLEYAITRKIAVELAASAGIGRLATTEEIYEWMRTYYPGSVPFYRGDNIHSNHPDGAFFTNDLWISTYRNDGLMDVVNIGNYDGVGIAGSSRCIGVSHIFPDCIDGPNNGRYPFVYNKDQNEAETFEQRLPNEGSTKNAGKLHNFGTRINSMNHIVIKKV